MNIGVLLFDDFETLDVFGPVEVFGRLVDHYKISFYSLPGGLIKNQHGISIQTNKIESIKTGLDIFLIPGGHGTRSEVYNTEMIAAIKNISEVSAYVLTVCTGSALLAKTGLLDGKKATSNKRAFNWVTSNGPHVHWIRQARWVVDGKFYTSSGVSAGMDMALGFLSDMHGKDFAAKTARHMEYNWRKDKDYDNFSTVHDTK
jgi:transcriptional regulator GlxA family with amidase domain